MPQTRVSGQTRQALDGVTLPMQRAIVALMTGSVDDAAEAAGVSTRTIRRWRQLPAFLAAFRAARADVVDTALAELQAATSDAVGTLRRNLRSGEPATEVRAATNILKLAIAAVERAEIVGRLEELEAIIAPTDGSRQ